MLAISIYLMLTSNQAPNCGLYMNQFIQSHNHYPGHHALNFLHGWANKDSKQLPNLHTASLTVVNTYYELTMDCTDSFKYINLVYLQNILIDSYLYQLLSLYFYFKADKKIN